MSTDWDWLRFEYFRYGTDYYVMGRFAYFTHAIPTACNLFHHAVEYFLKGYLCRRHMSEKDRRDLGHHLPNLLAEVAVSELTPFTALVDELHKFEELRYPDELIKGTTIAIGVSIVHPTPEPDRYFKLGSIDEIDHFVELMFKVASVNPKAFAPSHDALTYLVVHNTRAEIWKNPTTTEPLDPTKTPPS
jgi:hypothetical protein